MKQDHYINAYSSVERQIQIDVEDEVFQVSDTATLIKSDK